MRIALYALVLAALSGPATAESLGITGAEFRLGASTAATDPEAALGPVATDRAPDLFLGVAAVDVAITEVHGLQLDVVLENGPDGAIGRLGSHLFMSPRDDQKYGLFATLSDLGGTEATWGSFGAEGILALSPVASIALSGGVGYGSAKLDWIFAGAGLTRGAGATTLHAGLELTQFDEPGFHSLAATTRLGLEARLGPRLGAFGEILHARLAGTAAAPQTLLRTGFTLRFGPLGGAAPRTRLFSTPDPVAQLARRGWF